VWAAPAAARDAQRWSPGCGTSILAEALSALPCHTCRASFVALFAAALLGRTRPWLCGGVAVWALTTALSRAAMGRHYLSDVLAGLLLGAVTVGIVTRVGGWVAGELSSPWDWRVYGPARLGTWHVLA
jgi:hypothetical protein